MLETFRPRLGSLLAIGALALLGSAGGPLAVTASAVGAGAPGHQVTVLADAAPEQKATAGLGGGCNPSIQCCF